MPLKRFIDSFDWLPITEIVGKTRFSRQGRKKYFSNISIFKAFLLKSYLLIDDNTVLVKRLHENKLYLEFCNFEKVPSHDVLSKFERGYAHTFERIFVFLDDVLKKHNAFEHDDSSFDGTDIPVPFKHRNSTSL